MVLLLFKAERNLSYFHVQTCTYFYSQQMLVEALYAPGIYGKSLLNQRQKSVREAEHWALFTTLEKEHAHKEKE